MVADVTAAGSPNRAERYIWGLPGCFLVSSGHFCGRGTTLRCRTLLLRPENFAQGHLMKIECLIADETSFVSPDRAERDILGMIVCVFLPIQAAFVIWQPRCDE